ncbi:helix-turn-helix transcriptional regulator [Fulvimarina sp. MAC8]|uniref:helix-turn-helix transcriptional regulator n=1 Tax=Fulvimarina sp. MAC8 TaxID=3162874 RepID=UPI0032EF50BB
MNSWELADGLTHLRNIDDVWSETFGYFTAIGVDGVIFVDRDADGTIEVRSNCPPEWMHDHIADMRTGNEPFVRCCLGTYDSIPTGADYLEIYDFLAPQDRSIIMDAKDRTGFRAGRSVTTRAETSETVAATGWHLLTSRGSADFERQFVSQGADIGGICHLVAAKLACLEREREESYRRRVKGGQRTSLSPRERECLQFIATGQRVSEISHRLKIAEKTVELHLANARKRLGARTRDEAVAKALLSLAIEL